MAKNFYTFWRIYYWGQTYIERSSIVLSLLKIIAKARKDNWTSEQILLEVENMSKILEDA